MSSWNSLSGYVNSKWNLGRMHLLVRMHGRLVQVHEEADQRAAEKVLVITTEGNTFAGTLLCVDHVTNLALENAVQRFIVPHDSDEESHDVPQMGTVLIRGDQVVLCGLVDEELDRQIDVTKMRGAVILSTKKNT